MSPSQTLARYRRMRNFHLTPEPSGKKKASGRQPIFVIQKHAASHLHYDFRLEAEGVLKSWAIPKGPSTDPSVKRLAIQTEDHPLDYAGFEGVIPKGQYGGGNVIVWDRGTFRNTTLHRSAPVPLPDAIQRGHITIWLDGEKLRGGFALTRTGFRGNKAQWLCVKIQDAEARQPVEPVIDLPQSVLSGRDVETMQRPAALPKAPLPKSKETAGWMAPMLATLVDEPFDRPDWVYEPKLDGERCLCYRRGNQIEMFSRNQQLLNETYPEILEALKKQKAGSFILDGEIVAFDPGTDRSSFKHLQQRMHIKNSQEAKKSSVAVFYVLFDILSLNGRDVRRLPLLERKALLKRSIQFNAKLRMNPVTEKNGMELYRQACRNRWEGVIAKRRESVYLPGRTRDWLKFKCSGEQEFVIGGYTDPQGERDAFGALLIGYYDGGQFKFAGKVGTGFDAATLSLVAKKMKPLTRKSPPFEVSDLPRRGLHWVEPKLVAQVAFSEWTEDGKLRHPRFLGLRDDKSAAEVVREKPVDASAVQPSPRADTAAPNSPKPPAQAKAAGDSSQLRIQNKTVKVTHLNKVFYPSTGFTKGQMLDYYIKIGPTLLPYINNRPMTLKRYPNGVESDFFYEKEAPSYRPDWMHTYGMDDGKGGKTTHYCLINDLASLVWIVNLASVEMHALLARAPQVGSPTWIAIDLDPGAPATLLDCIRVGLKLHALLDRLGLKNFAKTSGSKGLHVYIPLNTKTTYEATQDFAHGLAVLLEKEDPRRVVSTMRKELRTGKVLVDWSQNSRHKTTVSVYSLRAQPEPSVSTPVTWEELKKVSGPGDLARLRFTPEQVLERIRQKGDLFAPILTLRQKLPPLTKGDSHGKDS